MNDFKVASSGDYLFKMMYKSVPVAIQAERIEIYGNESFGSVLVNESLLTRIFRF